MTIIFYDGGVMECSEIEFGSDGLIVDGYRLVPLIEVLRIISD